MELGGSIELIGFNSQDSNDLVIVKKIVGNYAKTLSDRYAAFTGLVISLKEVHREHKRNAYELHGQILLGAEEVSAEHTDVNLYFALDALLKKLSSQLDTPVN